jgi:hypothetical protein
MKLICTINFMIVFIFSIGTTLQMIPNNHKKNIIITLICKNEKKCYKVLMDKNMRNSTIK